MQKLVFFVLGFGALVGIMMPSDKPTVASAKAEPGLFESPAYEETQLKRRDNGHFYVTAEVNGADIEFLVDTGASTVALTEEDAEAAGLDFSPDEFEPVARTANGIARGKALTLPKVTVDGKEVMEVEALILANSEVSLLGQSYLSRIGGVQMSGDTMVLR
jgi:aspartyl protease family protein